MTEPLRILEQASRLVRHGEKAWTAFLENDKQFHLALARMTGNPIHYYLLKTVQEYIHQYNFKRYLPKGKALMERSVGDLNDLVEAVSQGNADLAGTLARDHVVRFNEMMEVEASRQIQV